MAALNWRSDFPRRASLAALSFAIRASNPKRTRAVFSLTPVKEEALDSISSLMMRVVLICINMHYAYAYLKVNVA